MKISGEPTLQGELREKGFHVTPGQLGENVTTRGIDLLALSPGARSNPSNPEADGPTPTLRWSRC